MTKNWYTIRNTAQGPSEVLIYDEIGTFGVTAQDFLNDLGKSDGPLNLRLNTPGGEVFDGIAIYNALKARKAPVSVAIDGIAASIGSVIAMAASPGMLSIAKRASIMIHDGFSSCTGNARDMRDLAELLDKQSDNIAGIYADRTGKPASYWRDQMRTESWFVGEQAVKEGLADQVTDSQTVKATWDMSKYRNIPNTVLNAGMNPDEDTDGDNDYGWTIRDGKPVFDPDGDGDDDTCAATDTDHGWWDENGCLKKPIPPTPAHIVQAVSGGKKTRNKKHLRLLNEKYNTDDRKRMAKAGQAMDDGSYPIADEEDLGNAIHAVGRGGADHDKIRRHIMKRAKALGKQDAIPENWNPDGSIGNSLAGFLSSLRDSLRED